MKNKICKIIRPHMARPPSRRGTICSEFTVTEGLKNDNRWRDMLCTGPYGFYFKGQLSLMLELSGAMMARRLFVTITDRRPYGKNKKVDISITRT